MFVVEMSSMSMSDVQLEMTSVYCHVLGHGTTYGDTTYDDQLSARHHHWNTLFFVGLFTAKVTMFNCIQKRSQCSFCIYCGHPERVFHE